MQVKRTDKSTTEVTLVVTGDAADLAPIKETALLKLAPRVKIPGFRSGKAPLTLIEKQIDQRTLIDEFLDNALNVLYSEALDAEKLRPVASPQVELKKFVPFTQLVFEAAVPVVGPVDLPNYKSIRKSKPKVSVTAKDVTDVLEALAERQAERVPVGRAAKEGDEVVIDFKGTDSKGKAISGADGKDYPLKLGSKTFIPGFEEHVIGVKAGEDKSFTVTFPADYGVKTLQSKKVTFDISAKSVSELQKPKIDDNFAKQAGPFSNLDELKADVKKQVTSERELEADREYENLVLREIVDKSKVEIPRPLVDEQIQTLEAEERRNLTYRGQTWQEHLDLEGITEEEHRERQRPDASDRVKAGLVISEIADKEKLTVTPEELEVRIQVLKGQYSDSQMQAELDSQAGRRDIAGRILTEKTIAKIIEYASKPAKSTPKK